METNISINKIISILIAIIVASCVLIPICNELGSNGNGGGESRSGGDGDLVLNLGNALTNLGSVDTSKRFYFDSNSGLEYGTVVTLEVVYGLVDGVPKYYNATYPSANSDDFTIEYSEGKWLRTNFNTGMVNQWIGSPNEYYVYDEQGEYWGVSTTDWSSVVLTTDEFVGNGTLSLSEIGENNEYGWDITYNISDGEVTPTSWPWIWYGDNIWDTLDNTIDLPTFTIGNNGKLHADGLIRVKDGSNWLEFEWSDATVTGLVPKYVPANSDDGNDNGNSGSNSGIAGTLITIIPVFVLLAILGSIAYMFVNRNETN